jgi:hypothetical protein
LAGALQVARDLGGDDGARAGVLAREAFVSGMHLAAIIAGCVSLVAAVVVYRKLPSSNPHARGAADVGPPAAGTLTDREPVS